ncbi:hypothetical protein ACFFUS_09765 [Vibrio gallaecicus]|uniref:hypothetical protein n=1 Tax=Vibrio gallaecicus TaxID=552386 RepID=UPI0010C9C20F|nr:hypothetical protein [Vibrio gallaecicus]
MEHLRMGLSQASIAKLLDISARTLIDYLRRQDLKAKLNVGCETSVWLDEYITIYDLFACYF